MKKSVLFSAMCIALMSLSLVSCEKEETFSPVGIWNVEKVTANQYVDGILTNTEAENAAEMGKEAWIYFNTDGTFSSLGFDGIVITGTYLFSDDFSLLVMSSEGPSISKVTKVSNDNIRLTSEVDRDTTNRW